MSEHPCQALLWVGLDCSLNGRALCGRTDPEKPMTFKGTDWCCENHRKLVVRQRDMAEGSNSL